MAYVPQQIRGRGRMGGACRPRPVLFPLHTTNVPNSKSRGPAGHALGEVTLLRLPVLPREASVDSAPPTPAPVGLMFQSGLSPSVHLVGQGLLGHAGSCGPSRPAQDLAGSGEVWGGREVSHPLGHFPLSSCLSPASPAQVPPAEEPGKGEVWGFTGKGGLLLMGPGEALRGTRVDSPRRRFLLARAQEGGCLELSALWPEKTGVPGIRSLAGRSEHVVRRPTQWCCGASSPPGVR